MTRVLKFGGAALRDAAGVARVSRLVRSHGGRRPLLVVSAHYGVTDALLRIAGDPSSWRAGWDELRVRHRTLLRQLELPSDLLDRHLTELRGVLALGAGAPGDVRRQDFVLSFGERMSARIVAASLRRLGWRALPVDAFDLGLECQPAGEALEPRAESLEALGRGLARIDGLPVVTGFLARDARGDLLTLGRDGTELTAAWLALATGAEEVQLWKEEPGIRSADPRVVPGAPTVPALTWDDAELLARHSSGVLHPGCIAPLRRSGARVGVLDVRRPEGAGTRVAGDGRSPLLVAWAHRSGLARERLEPGTAPPPGLLATRALGGGRREALVRRPVPAREGWSLCVPVGGAELGAGAPGGPPGAEVWPRDGEGPRGFPGGWVVPDGRLAAALAHLCRALPVPRPDAAPATLTTRV